jgi:DNA-binding MarR family transcriptional regulator
MDIRYSQLDLDVQICFPLYAATRAVTHAYAQLLDEVGLTYPQYLTMLALWGANKPLTVGALGARLRLDSGTLTPLLKRLEAAGHVIRRRDSTDERRVLLEVSDEGWELRDRVAHVPAALVRSMSMGSKDDAELRRLLKELLENPDAADQ